MKRKTSHKFAYRGRDWTLMRRGNKWTIRLTVAGKLVWRSLRTGDTDLAETRAKRKIEELASGKLGKEVSENPPGTHIPTLGKVAEIYRAARVVREATARDSVSTLLHVVRTVTRIQDVASLRVDVLSAGLAEAWLAHKQGLDRPDYGTLRAGNVSANSSLRQARAVFARRHRSIYAGWKIPECVDAFCATKFLPEASARYVPLPSSVLAGMDKAAEGLRETDLEMWIVNRSIRLMGLRAGEVAAMKTTWLVDRDGVLSLDIRARPGEWVPKGHQGAVTVPAVLAGIFRRRLDEAGDNPEHLVRVAPKPKGKKGKRALGDPHTERHSLIYRRHSLWLRTWIVDRNKTNHELRKEAGSRVAKKLNSWEAAARFLREDLETAKKHYLELLEPVGLEEEDL